MRLLGGCELDARGSVSGVERLHCSSNLGLSRAGILSARAVWGSSNFTTHWTMAAGLLAKTLKPQRQVWFPLCLGMISGRAGVLRSRAALHNPVASRKMDKAPKIAARMYNGTPRKSCIYVSPVSAH